MPTSTAAAVTVESTPATGPQHWTVPVRNDSDKPVRLVVARYGPSATIGTLVGWTDPEVVPPGQWLDVTLTAPANQFGWRVFIRVGVQEVGAIPRGDLGQIEVYVGAGGRVATGADATRVGPAGLPPGLQEWTVPVRNDSDQAVWLVVARDGVPPRPVGTSDPEAVQPGEWLNVVLTPPLPQGSARLPAPVFVIVRVGPGDHTRAFGYTSAFGWGSWGARTEVYVNAAGQCLIGERAAQRGDWRWPEGMVRPPPRDDAWRGAGRP